MRTMIEAFEAVNKRGPVTEWELSCIQSVWNAHYEHIHAHHSNEDDLLAPWLAERINLPEKVSDDFRRSTVVRRKNPFLVTGCSCRQFVDAPHRLEICFSLAHTYLTFFLTNPNRFTYLLQLEQDHVVLVDFLDRFGKMISELKVGTVVSDKMVKELVDYEVMMKGHLKEEEDISLLLTRAYFTPSELAPKIQEIIGHGPKVCAEH